MADQAHSLHCKTRSLGDIQTLAVQGMLGKVPGALKPLYIPDLPVNDIRKEAVARGKAVTGKNRATLQKELQEILQGVQRVPSLLLLQPDESLTNLNLQYYEVMDCEPLHDIKGHLLNLFQELPSVLPTSVKHECVNQINMSLKKEKITASDLGSTLVQLFLQVYNTDADWKTITLLQSMVIICEILYSDHKARTPKNLLRLYNNVWIHHQLCYDLFQSPKCALFGLYLHSLSSHAPEQYELVYMYEVT